MTHEALLHELNLLFFEENHVHHLGLEEVDVLEGEGDIGERSLVVVVVNEVYLFPEEGADLLHLLLVVVLHLALALVLGNCIDDFADINGHRFLVVEDLPNDGGTGNLHPQEVQYLIEVYLRIDGQVLQFTLEVIEKLHAREILIDEFVVLHEDQGSENCQGQLLAFVEVRFESYPGHTLEGLVDQGVELLKFIAVALVGIPDVAQEHLGTVLHKVADLHLSLNCIIQQVRDPIGSVNNSQKGQCSHSGHQRNPKHWASLQQNHLMTEILYELVSATNFSESASQAFNKPTRSIISWESTEFAIPPIDLLFKLEALAFVTEIYLHPKRNKYIKLLEVLISEDNNVFSSVAKIYDLTDAVRIQISSRCRYLKMKTLDKEQGKPASIDLLRIYGHPYFKYQEDTLFYSQKKEQVDELLLQHGFNRHDRWEVDSETLITLNDMSRLQNEYITNGQKPKLEALLKDFKTVLKLGEKIKELENSKKYLNAKERLQEIKDIEDNIKVLSQRRDFYDEKYETQRFERMIALDDFDNRHDELLKNLLEKDKTALEEERRMREEQAMKREMELNNEFDAVEEDEEWWKKDNELDNIEEDAPREKKPTVEKVKKEKEKELDEDYKFKNPYVYNQGDADMEKYIRPLNEFTGDGVADPELLRKYEQLEYLDVLGAKIWISAHSQNWRQRAAAVEAVLNFAQDKLPQRYKDGKTKNLFLALMQFARINAQDKVLQIYYTSLKIMTIALQPPICGEDVSTVLINKSIQKFMSILVDKISEMNARAKEISLKQLITIFKHPVADLSIAINECLKICREELNVKFVPVDKQNPRIVISRLEIIDKMMGEFKLEKRKVDFRDILTLLVEGALYHNNSEVRTTAAKTLEHINKAYPQGTAEWYKNLKGLKPNIAAELQEKLKIN